MAIKGLPTSVTNARQPAQPTQDSIQRQVDNLVQPVNQILNVLNSGFSGTGTTVTAAGRTCLGPFGVGGEINNAIVWIGVALAPGATSSGIPQYGTMQVPNPMIMPFSGSIVGLSLSGQTAAGASAVSVNAWAYKNGTQISGTLISAPSSLTPTAQSAFTAGLYTFAAGDSLNVGFQPSNSGVNDAAYVGYLWVLTN